APGVTAAAPIVVAATQATGARANVPASQAPGTPALLSFRGAGSERDLADLNPQRRPARRVNCAQPASVLETIVDTTLFTLGQNCVDVEFGDASGNVGHATAVFDVA